MTALARAFALCHRNRTAFAAGLCRECWQCAQATRRHGDPRPARVLFVVQQAAQTIPPTCPKCHAPPPAWRVGLLEGSCLMCGTDVFAVADRAVVLPTHRPHQGRKEIP